MNVPDIVVLDASVAVRVAMDPEADFRATLQPAELVIAPELIVADEDFAECCQDCSQSASKIGPKREQRFGLNRGYCNLPSAITGS